MEKRSKHDHDKKMTYKLRDLMGDAANDVMLRYTKTAEGCAELHSMCAKHCASLGSGLFKEGLSAKLTGNNWKYQGSLGMYALNTV